VTVTVADRGGMPIAVLVGEGARYVTREVTPPQSLHGRPVENVDRGIHEKVSNARRL
jgi:hypothetical protein